MNFFIEDTLTSYTTIFSEGIYDDSLSNIDSARLRVKVEAFLDTNNIKVIHPDEKFILDIEVDNKKSLDIIFSSLMDTTGSEKIIKLYEDSTEIKFDSDKSILSSKCILCDNSVGSIRCSVTSAWLGNKESALVLKKFNNLIS